MTVTASTTQADFFVADPITRVPPVPRQPSRQLVRYVLAVSFGVAATLAWQSYGQLTKQIIAARAPDLGWSPQAKHMIANWVEQIGWTKQLADAEHAPPVPQNAQASTGAQAASDKFSTTASVDPQQVHQIALDVAAVRQILEQVAAGQTKMAGEINNLLVTDMEMFLKIPAPTVAAAPPSRKPTPVAPPLRAPNRRTDLIPDQSLADSFRN